MLIILLWLKKSNQKAPKSKVGGRVRTTKKLSKRIILAKVTSKIGRGEMFVINSKLKTNPQTYKIKHLHGEKIIISFL